MKFARMILYFATIILFLTVPISTYSQAWSGILDPNRAVNWSTAGVTGGIPNRTTVCAALSAGASAAQISSAITACPSGQVVSLAAGAYNLPSGIDFGGVSNVTLRGAGADQTIIKFTGSVSCRGFAASICIGSSSNPQMPSPNSAANWTSGYAPGTTTITLSSTSGLSVNSVLILDQLDDASDTGSIFICSTINVCVNEGGNSYGRSGRAQQELVRVTAINGNNVTITPGLVMPNWRSGQAPGASWASPGIHGDSVENLSIDQTGVGSDGIVMLYVYDCWVKGVRSVNANRNHVYLYQTVSSSILDSYLYGTQNSASQSYGIETFSTSHNLAQNNITQHVTGPITINGADVASVYGFNYAIDDYYAVSSSWMIPSIIAHEAGTAYDLFEGNSGLGFEGDAIHGTHHFLTAFRNVLQGDLYNNPPKNSNTTMVHLWAFSRYFNIVGNVLGRGDNFYSTYQTLLNDSGNEIYSLGGAGAASSPSDALVQTTLFRWGNYDTVNKAVRFVTSEVPSGLSSFPNPVPGSQALPASFYLSSKPAWFGSTQWPAIGSDVAGGDIAGVGGHAYTIPAQACFNNSPIDSKYGSNNVRLFNASGCYSGAAAPKPNPPTGVQATSH